MDVPMEDPRPVSANQEFAELRKDLDAYKKRTWWTVRILIIIAFLVSCGVPMVVCGVMFLVTVTDPPSTHIGKIMLPLGCLSLCLGATVFCICRKKIATKRQYQSILSRRGMDPHAGRHRPFYPERFQMENLESNRSTRCHNRDITRVISSHRERPTRSLNAEEAPPPSYREVVGGF